MGMALIACVNVINQNKDRYMIPMMTDQLYFGSGLIIVRDDMQSGSKKFLRPGGMFLIVVRSQISRQMSQTTAVTAHQNHAQNLSLPSVLRKTVVVPLIAIS
jgi:hypothetical protein